MNLIAAEKSAPALSDSRPALSGSPALQGKLAQADWSVYLGDKGRRQSSPLAQIDKRNVAQLQVAWTYDTGEKGEYQSNNLVIAGVLYTASASRRVIALDAATGQELWTWDPTTERAGAGARRQRGVAYWENETGGERRIFTVVGNYLYALSPETGLPIRSFGDNGSLHLGIGMDLEETPSVSLNTPGVVYQDLLIIGANTDAPGAIRALDVRTGHRRWIFHLIPRPGEFGYDTWPVDAYKTIGGASAWSGQSLDEARGIVYISSETAGPDFYGGARHGMNLFANSVVALDAGTGRRLWHFQIVHHDLLDKDLPAPPVLITVTHRGKQIDAVAQGTKHGLLFVFDRVTGEPLWPIEERPVPQTDLAGEQTWPTQPFPVKPAPLMRQSYTEADISNVSPEAQLMSLDRIKVSPNFGPFPAPSLRETIMFPGFDGGFEWGGAAANSNGILYVNINEMPWILRMIDPRRPDGTRVSEGERQYMIHCAACHGIDRMGDIRGGFPSLVEIEKRRTPEQVRQLVTQGGGRMPAFDRLPERQLSAVLNLIQGVEPPPRASRPPGVGEAGGGGASPESEGPRYAFGGFRR
ncbi:MAG: PQQ-binding-like beta-propeller repeat protein, partial [Verrucomicrobia bacterium]|nr:PQQ-binding-like beta-propeller repeat protein [Verrucomicrobiota bacterium]